MIGNTKLKGYESTNRDFNFPPVLDIDLVRRYDKTGPRYTSYPTAVQFSDQFGEADYLASVAESNALPVPPALSLYFHIPFCATLCYYCACNKVVTKNKHKAEEYLSRLYVEIELQGALYDHDRQVRQLHFGGGTPTFLNIEQLEKLLQFSGQHFTLNRKNPHDYSIEIDPRTVAVQDIWRLRNIGFNRLSMGVQDFDPAVQKAVHRIQSPEDTLALIDAARAAHFDSISVDLIYGLPLQSETSFQQTMARIIEAAPDRLSVFNYAHLPERFIPQRRINSDDLPSAEEKLRILQNTVEQLAAAGYVYIGMDHFAKPDDSLTLARENGTLYRNFQGYASHADCDLIGLGVSSISKVDHCYSQNAHDIDRYYRAIDSGSLPIERGIKLSDDDNLRRRIIEALMCYGVVDFSLVEDRYKVDFVDYFAEEMDQLKELEDDGLVELSLNGITITPAGRFLLRNVAMVFDAYLHGEASAHYSRTI